MAVSKVNKPAHSLFLQYASVKYRHRKSAAKN